MSDKFVIEDDGPHSFDQFPKPLRVGDRVPMPPKPAPRPAFTGSGKPSFKPARKK